MGKPTKRDMQSTIDTLKSQITRLEAELTAQREQNPEVAYWQDVRGVVIELEQLWNGGEWSSREEAFDWLHETIDGHARVIYTHKAQECLLVSPNDAAYIDDYGPGGIVSEGNLNWSVLAYAAFEADILASLSININEDPPQPGDDSDA